MDYLEANMQIGGSHAGPEIMLLTITSGARRPSQAQRIRRPGEGTARDKPVDQGLVQAATVHIIQPCDPSGCQSSI
jgi:hypothetical protein